MSQENIQIVATARDQASAVLKKLNTNVAAVGSKGRGPLGGLLSGIGGISPVAMGAALGVGILTAKLAAGVAGALAEEKQMGRLEQALKNNVKGWDGSTEAMENAAGAAMNLAFSDDDARESLIKLVTATGNQEEATRDMSLAMDIARGRNIDLGAATDIVIKAHMGNVGALRRLGIEVDKNATSTEILTELQKRYNDQAEAYAKTTAGKFEAAQVKVDNTMEDFGHTIIETTGGLLSVSDALKGDTDASSDFMHAVGNLVPGISLLADELDKLTHDATTTSFEFGVVARTLPKNVAEGIESGTPAVRVAMNEMFMFDRAAEFEAAAKQFGNLFTDDLAGSLRSNKDVVEDAMDTVTWAIKHPMQLQKELARIEGALTTLEYQRGLAEGNPGLTAIIDQQMGILKGQWTSLTGTAYTKGVDIATALENGLGTFVAPRFPLGLGGKGPSRLHGADKGAIEGYAHGGYMSPGEVGVVGERGPELIRAGRNGASVTPNNALGHGHDVYMDGVLVGRLIDQRQGRMLAVAPQSSYSR